MVRKDVTESQTGVPLALDIQVLDIDTCEPVSNVYLDFWHCNSTGVYSGVNTNGNGNSDDTTNINNTFLRGIQKADNDGVVVFDSLFPGHYTGRATHIHIMAHLNATVADNNTLASQGSIAHVGQIFFDQDLIAEVEAVEPYSSNTQDLTTNADDRIAQQAAMDVDPFASYVLLGHSISDGILAWTTIAVNLTANSSVQAAGHVYADGGVANENTGGFGPGGSGGPPGSSNGTIVPVNGTGSAGSSAIETGLDSIASATSTASASVATSTLKSAGRRSAARLLKSLMLGAGIGGFMW